MQEDHHHQTLNKDNSQIVGNYNTIKGNNNTIKGSYNKVIGNKNKVEGNQNFIVGSENETQGIQNVVIGAQCAVIESERKQSEFLFINFIDKVSQDPFQNCSDEEKKWIHEMTTIPQPLELPVPVFISPPPQSVEPPVPVQVSPPPPPQPVEPPVPVQVSPPQPRIQEIEEKKNEFKEVELCFWNRVLLKLSRGSDHTILPEEEGKLKACSLCMSNEVKTVNLNCGHSIACLGCAIMLIQNFLNTFHVRRKKLRCPNCSQPMSDLIELFH